MKTGWYVIADDLSGAAEIAGLAHQFGRSARIITPGLLPSKVEEDVLVVNTDSRNMPVNKAVSTIREVLKNLGPLDGIKLFKKTDSLLRGPVGAEILAILDAAYFSTALLVPANPSKGRTIRAGKYFIGPEALDNTEYRYDPEYPRTSSHLRDLLKVDLKRLDIQCLDWKHTAGKILVPDLSKEEEISALIRKRIFPGMLPAGGADFFRGLLRSMYGSMKQDNTISYPRHGKQCFISGSHALASRKSMDVLKQHGYSVFEIHLPAERDADYQKQLHGGRVVLKLQDRLVKDPGRRDLLLEELSKRASDLALARREPTHFLVTGGRTAALFCRKMDWDQLLVKAVCKEGVVTLSPMKSNHLITIKPGSYDWPENLIKQ